MRRLWRGTYLLGLAMGVVGCDDPPRPDLPAPTGTGPGLHASATASAAPKADDADLEHLALLRRAAEQNPESAASQVRLARHCIELSRWDEADAAVKAALALQADHSTAQRLKHYLPRLRAAKSLGERRKIEMDMAGESLSELGEKLEGTVSREAFDERTAAREAELRQRLGVTDALLVAQRPRQAPALLRLNQALGAMESSTEKEGHVRRILAEEPARVGAMVKLLDVLIEQHRYEDATRDLAAFRKTFPDDLVLRLYEQHLKALASAEDDGRARAIVRALAMDRRTLMTMISNAKIGKLQRKPR